MSLPMAVGMMSVLGISSIFVIDQSASLQRSARAAAPLP
jgi:hypothetical protein